MSGYLEAVRGSLTGSSQKAADHRGFLQTVYRKVAKILRDSESMHRYKVVEAALDLLKEHAAHFREFFLSDSKEESPATIYDVLLRLCVHVNKEVKTSALVCVLPRPLCLSPVSVRDARQSLLRSSWAPLLCRKQPTRGWARSRPCLRHKINTS